MNPTPHIIESALLLLAAFLIGCVVGYVLRKLVHKTPSASRTVDAPPEPDSKPAVDSSPPSAVTARQTAKVDAATAERPAVRKKASSKTATTANAKQPAPRKAAASKPLKASAATAPKPVKPDAPVLLDAPRGGMADDLKKIKGIGPKLETLLNRNGVYHYDQIAAWNPKAVAIMDEKLSFRGRIEREDWVAQAKALNKKS